MSGRLSKFSRRAAALALNISNIVRVETISPENEASYARIIDSILAASDLTTISAKRIRRGLQTALDHDIDPYKVSVWRPAPHPSHS